MRFRIIENKKIKETPYEIFYFDENNSRGPKWLKVVWDEESYIHFCDKNFVATIDEANTKAKICLVIGKKNMTMMTDRQ